MWIYEKKLQFPVKIKNPNPQLANIIISQLGGPDGELAASMRYLHQRYSMPFKQVTGQTPLEYRTRIRIESAKQMLESGELSIAEIGEKIGFSSPAHFSTVFKKLVGISPKKYAE